MFGDNTIAYLGLGSNLDNPKQQIRKALLSLKNVKGINLLSLSSIYVSDPVGFDDQPVFLNAVAKLKVKQSAMVLLRRLQFIESRQHRVRSSNQNAPRTLDLDILLMGKQIISNDVLTVPHPRMVHRRFVLEPLLELSPHVEIPTYGLAARFLGGVMNQGCFRAGRILL